MGLQKGRIMSSDLKQAIGKFLETHVDVWGVASAERFADAPEAHRPARICRNAATVVVFGIAMPQGILSSPDYNLYALHRCYHSTYKRLDEISLALCNYLEARGKWLAVPVPSYAPLVFHKLEPWGMLSLKHAAVNAGLGSFGRSGQTYHPQYGSRLRFGAVITDAKIEADPLLAPDPCPPNCTACAKACPAKAFDINGRFHKMTCLGFAIKHAIYPLTLQSKEGLARIERVVNTAGDNYWIACDECIKVCPLNSDHRQ